MLGLGLGSGMLLLLKVSSTIGVRICLGFNVCLPCRPPSSPRRRHVFKERAHFCFLQEISRWI